MNLWRHHMNNSATFEDILIREYLHIGENSFADDQVLTESAASSVMNKFRSRFPRTSIYSDGRDGIISIAKDGNGYSLFHSKSGRVVFEQPRIDKNDALDYVESLSYRKVTNWKGILQIAGVFAAGALMAVGAGTVAMLSVRLIISLGTMYLASETPQVSPEAIDAAKRVASSMRDTISNSVSTSGGDVVVNISKLDEPISAGITSDNIIGNIAGGIATVSSALMKMGWWYVSN